MPKKSKAREFPISKNDPLASEHSAIAAWIQESLVAGFGRIHDVKLSSQPSGRRLLKASPDKSRKYMLAAIAQVRYWDKKANRFREFHPNLMQRFEQTEGPSWAFVWRRRRQAEAVVRAMLRRTLMLRSNELLVILNWCNTGENASETFAPIGLVARALKRYATTSRFDQKLRVAIKTLGEKLKAAEEDDDMRSARIIERLCKEKQT